MEMADDVGHCYPAESKVALLCYRNNANVLGMGYCRPPQGLPNNKTSTFGAQAPTQGLSDDVAQFNKVANRKLGNRKSRDLNFLASNFLGLIQSDPGQGGAPFECKYGREGELGSIGGHKLFKPSTCLVQYGRPIIAIH